MSWKKTYICLLLILISSHTTIANPCSCHRTCVSNLDDPDQVDSQIYVYDAVAVSCIQLPSSCLQETKANCTFKSQEECEALCGKKCVDTKFGCCPDGSVRSEHDDCLNTANAANSQSLSHAINVRWNLVGTGLCVLVLLVAVLAISGTIAYNQRHKKRERLRSRYIYNVLEMYNSESESSGSEVDRGKQSIKVKGQNKNQFVKM